MSHSRETILLVDDEETVRRFGSRVLEKHGFQVITAGSGHEALDAGDGRAIHLLMTDVMMPGMNGCQLAEVLLARQPSLRVLFISGYAEDVLVSNVGLVPGAAFLSKPFKPKALVTKVREVLDSSSGREPRSSRPIA